MLQKTSKFSVFSGPPVEINDSHNLLSNSNVQNLPLEHNFGDAFDRCQHIYDEIFSNIPCERSCKASLLDRDSMKVQKNYTLTYGELVDMSPIWKLVSKLELECGWSSSSVSRFYDLGSGSGRPVVAAALALSHHRKQSLRNLNRFQCIGIEVLPGLYDLSLLAQAKWVEYNKVVYGDESSDSVANLQFHLGSIFDLSICDWTDGDMVFVNSTCFDVSMLLKVHDIAGGMKVGSIIITLSRSLIEIGALAQNIRSNGALTEESPTWQLLFETREKMSW